MKRLYNKKNLLLLLIYFMTFVFLFYELITDYSVVVLLLFVLVFTIIIVQIKFKTKYHSVESQAKELYDLTYKVKKIGAHAFNQFPVAIIYYNDDNKIEWANFYARKIFGEKFDLSKHKIGAEIKAVTYHMLEVKNKRPFHVQVLFDI